MKKAAIIAAAALLSAGLQAQKDELKTLKKIYERETTTEKDLAEYKAAVAKAETYLGTANDADRVAINFYKAETPFMDLAVAMQKPENQKNPMLMAQIFSPEKLDLIARTYADTREFEAKSGKLNFTKDIDETVKSYAPQLIDVAIAMGKAGKNAEAARLMYDVYLMDKKNQDNLFYAASFAVNGKDYDNALEYYNELKALKYSGEGMVYWATNTANNKEESFSSKALRDNMVSTKAYIKPRDEKLPSKRGEIFKNIALIYLQQGKKEEAKAAFADAIRENPDDTNLLASEANLYLDLKEYDVYKTKVAALMQKDPNNADLVYNLGVVAMQANQDKEAETYFNRALQIDPNYANAYMNLAALKLKGDEQVVQEMNNLGTSEKDNKRYDVLKKQRVAAFTAALPYLEKANALDPKNEAVYNNLLSVYNFLEMSDKAKALKARKP
jgi:tetratricopeptide (TPR) repeat protein